MKRHPVHTLLCLTPLALTLASCEKVEVIDEVPADGETTTVRILARTATPSDDLYPLRLYAFTNDGTLCSSQTVSAADEKISLSIPQGVETRVVAVTADDFDHVVCPLHVGKYTFVAVAHKAKNLDSPVATVTSTDKALLTESYVPKLVFAKTMDVTVAGNTTQNVTMDFDKRITSSFRLKS